MRNHTRRRRRGLTLLEIVLTFAIAMLILLALTTIMYSQFTNAQAGRDAVYEATVARSIMTRISADIVNHLGPVDARFLPNAILPDNVNQVPDGVAAGVATAANTAALAAQGGGAASTPAPSSVSASGTVNSAGTTTTASGATTASSTTAAAAPMASGSVSSSVATGSVTPVPSNLGVVGDAKWLVMSTNRIPGALLFSPKAPVMDDSIPSPDLRCLSLWLVPGKGLARNEMAAVTSDNAPTGQPVFDNEQQYVFGKEVVDVLFEYYDGTAWQPTWNGGTLAGNDGNTPIGPPSAIRITIWLQSGKADDGGDPPTVAYKHVVALPTSNQYIMAGPGINNNGQFLVPSLQAGQQIPAVNAGATAGSGSGTTGSTTGM
jgi:hypothetical protein